MKTSRHLILTGALVVLVVGLASVALGEEDHLVGYKSKDLDKVQPGGTYAVTNAFGATSCELKKAKFFLVRSEKDGADDPNGPAAGKYVCYKAKCTGVLPPTGTEMDQFGSHQLETKKVQILCAPAQAECEATTGGFCWFLGKINQSCDQICTDNDRTYDAATDTFAGSGGSNGNCAAVANEIGVPGAATPVACAEGWGCYVTGGMIIRCTTPTTSSDADPLVTRICACS